METTSKTFFQIAESNPCTGCSAPCCRMLLIPHPTPVNYMDLDYILYMLGFPNIEIVLSQSGQWQVLVNQVCTMLDQETKLCTVHGTPRKPKTCTFFNPYRCWYKRNFSTDQQSTELVRLNRSTMETIMSLVRFDDQETIIQIPTWEKIYGIVYPH